MAGRAWSPLTIERGTYRASTTWSRQPGWATSRVCSRPARWSPCSSPGRRSLPTWITAPIGRRHPGDVTLHREVDGLVEAEHVGKPRLGEWTQGDVEVGHADRAPSPRRPRRGGARHPVRRAARRAPERIVRPRPPLRRPPSVVSSARRDPGNGRRGRAPPQRPPPSECGITPPEARTASARPSTRLGTTRHGDKGRRRAAAAQLAGRSPGVEEPVVARCRSRCGGSGRGELRGPAGSSKGSRRATRRGEASV